MTSCVCLSINRDPIPPCRPARDCTMHAGWVHTSIVTQYYVFLSFRLRFRRLSLIAKDPSETRVFPFSQNVQKHQNPSPNLKKIMDRKVDRNLDLPTTFTTLLYQPHNHQDTSHRVRTEVSKPFLYTCNVTRSLLEPLNFAV